MNLFHCIYLIVIHQIVDRTYCTKIPFSKRHLLEKLETAERNKECCSKNMNCCKNDTNTPLKLQMRAILLRCPNATGTAGAKRNMKGKLASTREGELKSFQGYDESELVTRSEVTNCKRKLVVTMKFDTITTEKVQFVVIDHVFDPVTNKHQRLLNPYVIKLKESLIRQIYPLKFVSYVNSETYEVVHSKNEQNYTGCYTSGSNPTCGQVYYEGKAIQYSEGFCCSCDSLKNAQNQPVGNNQFDETVVSYSDPAHLLDGFECADQQPSSNQNKSCSNIQKNNAGSSSNVKNCNPSNLGEEDFGHDQMLSGGVQIRGGQNCADRYTPPNLDPVPYHESTHCLKFSDVWYGVFKLQSPKLEHSITLQIYEKHISSSGKAQWRDLTDGKPITLNLSTKAISGDCSKPTLASRYELNTKNPHFVLNYDKQRLLIPECTQSEAEKHPEMKGGPPEFLVLRHDKINLDGDQCNIPGVGFEAFYKQPNRCGVKKGTCLANQPKSLWMHDKQAEKHGKKGCFFLKNYAIVAENALQKNASNPSDIKLELLYNGKLYSTLDIEINADSNIVLRPNAAAMITEVYVDSTMASKTTITIKVTNMGLVAGKFLARLNDCPEDLPSTFNEIKSRLVLIPPQHQHIFTLNIGCKLPSDIFYCSAEVMNANDELVALRRIKIQKSDRCICTWHCLCACIGSSTGLKCLPMTLEHYHAAGFQGSLPISMYVVANSHLNELLSMILFIILFILLTLLLMGIAKALIGCCCSTAVGIWGLDIILDLPKRMCQYYESSIKDFNVQYDEDKWPIHPTTKEKVRNISKATEFCTNVVFFFLFPIMIIIRLIKRICSSRNNARKQKEQKIPPDSNDMNKQDEGDNEKENDDDDDVCSCAANECDSNNENTQTVDFACEEDCEEECAEGYIPEELVEEEENEDGNCSCNGETEENEDGNCSCNGETEESIGSEKISGEEQTQNADSHDTIDTEQTVIEA